VVSAFRCRLSFVYFFVVAAFLLLFRLFRVVAILVALGVPAGDGKA